MVQRRYADQAFEDFWAEFPRKVGKGAARKIWDRIRPDKDLVQKIARALEWQREQEQWRDPQFIPHPKTWLGQERWDDEPLTRRSAAPSAETKPWECPHLEPCSSRSMCDQATFLNRPLKGVLV